VVVACDILDMIYIFSRFFCREVTDIFCCWHTFIISLSVHGHSLISTTEQACSSGDNCDLYVEGAKQNFGWNSVCPNGGSAFAMFLVI
jgi:hypothetical protein